MRRDTLITKIWKFDRSEPGRKRENMLFQKKMVPLNNGKRAVLRSPEISDAGRLVSYMVQRAQETDYMLKDPDECGDPDTMAAEIAEVNSSPENVMIICELDGAIAGCGELHRQTLRKTFHRAELSIGNLKSYWGLGLGKTLMEELIQVAKERGITQLELNVFEGNERAMKLYEKLGFRVVAVRPNCVHWKDGSKLSAYSMFLSLE